MQTTISLPFTPSELPLPLNCLQTFSVGASIEQARSALISNETPSIITGSHKTPGTWWLAAKLAFPDADLLFQQENGTWLEITQGQIREHPTPAAQETPAPEPTHTPPLVQPPCTADESKDWPWEIFKLFIFNEPNAEERYQQFLRQAESRQPQNLSLLSTLEKAAKHGRHAAMLAASLEQKSKQGESADDIKAWINRLEKSQPSRVIKHLRTVLDKQFKFRNSKENLHKENSRFNITLPYTQLKGNLHPQNLRALAPAESWEIFIDETGTEFSGQAAELNESDKKLGRIVAVALPKGHSLPALKRPSHATELSNKDIQSLLADLTNSNAGVLGATLKVDLSSHSWIAAITKLARWVLLMLPLSATSHVTFKIENRSGYNNSSSLRGLEEYLTDTLRKLSPERFQRLKFSLELIDKNHPYNGYVDVIANCWGSNDDTKRRLLARTGWRKHCLLQSTDLAEVERLYMEAGSEPTTEAWFSICTHLAKEPGHSLFHDLLTQLGEKAQGNPGLWQKYLQEVRHRIALKNFNAGSLGRALEWLNLYRPFDAKLPGLLELQLHSAQLAAHNHLGQCDLNEVKKTMMLAQELMDEAAPDACEAALRIAISATNSFDFAGAVPFIENWLTQPVAVPGRLNYAKLHSTLGQLAAFRGEYDIAIGYFDNALGHFAKLSDQNLIASNSRQTNSYKAITLLDKGDTSASDTVCEVLHNATGKSGKQSVQQLARSGAPLRFEHYLMLRWLVSAPQENQPREDYLMVMESWQEGEGHPWMLINAYRAWLLADAGCTKEATYFLQQAIDQCAESENSAILQWMSHCFYALGESLKIQLDPIGQDYPGAPFPSEKMKELQVATTSAERINALNRLLPFNFH